MFIAHGVVLFLIAVKHETSLVDTGSEIEVTILLKICGIFFVGPYQISTLDQKPRAAMPYHMCSLQV